MTGILLGFVYGHTVVTYLLCNITWLHNSFVAWLKLS
jgi:hypothetical protein